MCPRKLELKYTTAGRSSKKRVSSKQMKDSKSPGFHYQSTELSGCSLQGGCWLQDIKLFSPQHQSEPSLFCIFQELLCLRLHFFGYKTKLEKEKKNIKKT